VKADDEVLVPITLMHEHGFSATWDDAGICRETLPDGSTVRRPDLDWGTQNGDLLIDPWIQDAMIQDAIKKMPKP
jgi:hypothetical protein